MLNRNSAILLSSLMLVSSFAAVQAADEEVNLYSARKEQLIKPLLDKFTEETNIKVNLVTGKADALLKRLTTEGKIAQLTCLLRLMPDDYTVQ